MSLPFKKATQKNLDSIKVFIEDNSLLSDSYFRISDAPSVLCKGKNLLRLTAHPFNLVENTPVLIEITDSNGDSIYYEIPDYIEDDKSRILSVWVYNDRGLDNTANGKATITIVGIAKLDKNGNTIPDEFKNNFNVRWKYEVNVDRNRTNVSSVIFKETNLPILSISESIEVYENLPQDNRNLLLVEQTGSAKYVLKGKTPIVQIIDSGEFNNEMVGYDLVLSNFTNPATPITNISNPINITEYTASISNLIDIKHAILNNPFTTKFKDKVDLIHTFDRINSADYTIRYFQSGSNVDTENQQSFANITFDNVDPITGVVDKVKVFIKSDGLPGEFELLSEVDVPFNNTFTIKVPIPTEHLYDPKRIKIQYLNSLGEISRTTSLTDPYVFNGGNTYIAGDNNLMTGSMYIGDSIGNGIELKGDSGSFIRSSNYAGFDNTISGSTPSGFLLYSGSIQNQISSSESYTGVGFEIIANSGSYLKVSETGRIEISGANLTKTAVTPSTYTINSVNALILDGIQGFTYNTSSSLADLSETAVSTSGGSGTDAKFSAEIDSGTLTVRTFQVGKDYQVNDVLTIPGKELGGTTPADDVELAVTSVITTDSDIDFFPIVVNLTPSFTRPYPTYLDVFMTGDFGYPINDTLTIRINPPTELVTGVTNGVSFSFVTATAFFVVSGSDPNEYVFSVVDNVGNYSAPYSILASSFKNL